MESREHRPTWWSGLIAAVSMVVYTVAVVAGRIYEGELDARGLDAQQGDLPTLIAFTLVMTVGCILVWLVSRNAVGWIFLIVALSGMFGFAGVNYAAYSAQIETLPIGVAIGWLSSWTWFLTLAGIMIFLPLFFPTGRLPSPRWRWVVGVACVGLFLLCGRYAFEPGELEVVPVVNPLGMRALEPVLSGMETTGALLLFVAAVGALVSAVMRFRRSLGQERQQLKWFVSALGLLIATSFLFIAFPALDELMTEALNDLIFAATVSFVPIAAGVAVLKYRLYAIDTIINRVLVYGLLTALLVAAYLGAVVAFQALLGPMTRESDLAVAASTLAVAAAFRPLRSRVQAFIDRRFYRRKYDAALTVQSFVARLRNEVELDVVRTDILTVVSDSVQPASLTLWLAPGGRSE